MTQLRIARPQCIGSHQPASPSDLLPFNRNDLAYCCDCGAVVSVWLSDGQWHRRGHEAGINMDEPELAAMIWAGVRGGAISLDYDPRQ